MTRHSILEILKILSRITKTCLSSITIPKQVLLLERLRLSLKGWDSTNSRTTTELALMSLCGSDLQTLALGNSLENLLSPLIKRMRHSHGELLLLTLIPKLSWNCPTISKTGKRLSLPTRHGVTSTTMHLE